MKSRLPIIVAAALLRLAPVHAEEAPIQVELDESAAALPEGEIRQAIQLELGRPVAAPGPGARGDVHVAVVNGQIVVRVTRGAQILERSVPLPANPGDVPLTVSLVVGNLARDQSREFEKPVTAPVAGSPGKPDATPPSTAAVAEPPARPARAPSTGQEPPPPPAYRSHWLGVHFAQDIAFVGGNSVCDPNLGQLSDNYACLYQGTTDQPFVHSPYPYRDSIRSGIVFATQRVLVSYEGAPSPWFSLGGRLGIAFGGGPPAGQRTDPDPPDRARGSGGTAFLPLHLELGARGWFLPLTGRTVRAYAKASFGIAQVDAKVEVPEYDCTHAGVRTINPADAAAQSTPYDHDMDRSTESLSPYEQCRQGRGFYNHGLYAPVLVDAWKKMGGLFVSLGAGGMIAVTDRLGVVLNVNAMLMLPAPGLVLEPSLGLEYGL
jgi:hypothetical protein